MTLSTDQQRVFNAICQFLKSDKQVFILQGSAGTGKTTLLAHIVKHLDDIHLVYRLMAPTGRAAHILKQKTGADASTIHRGIYDFEKLEVHINEADLAETDFKFHYPIKIEEGYPICIVDEGSMVGNHYNEGELWTFGSCRLLNDLTSYAKLDKKGKLIVIGDPAQLPPVKESVSLAMTSSYYEACGYKVDCECLTEVFRQEDTSEILRSACNIRSAIQLNDFTRISLPEGEEITALRSCDVARKYLELFPTPKLGNSVVICYSNATANRYNEQIRHLMYGDRAAHLQNGDIMMVVSNCYDRRKRDEEFIADCINDDISCVQYHDIMNGEFVQVLGYGNQEVHTIPVYENKERIHIPITFVDATVRLMSGQLHQCKMITEPILSAPRGTVSITLLKALFIDFCMRNKELRKYPQSEEFKKAIQEDPYLNALRVRYGYAITGHKSQGGEWDSIFVDFDGVHYSEPGARWIYTAITRARKHIYTINSVYTTPIHRLDIRTITRAATINEYYPSPLPVDSITSPFHTENDADYLKNKYAEVAICLNQSEYQVQSIEHLPYRERYTIRSANGLSFRVDYMYKKNGIFSHPTITPNNPELANLLSSPLVQAKVYPPLDYEPSNNTAQYLFEVMSQICDEVQVDILNVVERFEHYYIIYCLNTSSEYAWISFSVNAKGLITYGAPQAQDINDEKLILLIDKIQQLTEQSSSPN